MAMDLSTSLDLLDQKLRDHSPSTEASIQGLLAETIREVEDLPHNQVEIEASSGSKRLDILVRTSAAGIEIKYHRPIPSGTNRPMTQQYGALLADARKLVADQTLQERYLVLFTDRDGLTHIKNKNLLPTTWDRKKPITSPKIRGLAQTASRAATSAGEWIDLTAQMIWQARNVGPDRLTGLAWSVEPTHL